MKFDLLQAITDDNALANAYSDYLNDVASSYQSLLDAVSEATVHEYDVDDIKEAYYSVKDTINQMIVDEAADRGYILSEMDATSDEYHQLVDDIVRNSDDITAIVPQYFSSPQIILNHGDAFFNPMSVQSADTIVDAQKDLVVPISSTPDLFTYYKDFKSQVGYALIEVLQSSGFNSATPVTLKCGYTTVGDLLENVLIDQMNPTSTAGLKLELHDLEGSSLNYGFNRLYSLQTLTDEMKDTLSTTMATAAAFKATTLNNISDRINTFTSVVGSKISDTYQRTNAYITTLKMKISTTINSVRDFVSWFASQAGWDQLTEPGQTYNGFTNMDTAFSQFTGASPVPAIDFTFAAKVVVATAKSVALGAASVFQAIGNWFKKILAKIARKATETFVDPYDLKQLDNESTSGLVELWEVQDTSWITLPFSNSDDEWLEIRNWYINHADHAIKYDTIYGEAIFIPREYDFDEHNLFKVQLEFHFKAKPINQQVFKSIINDQGIINKYCAKKEGVVVHSDGVYNLSCTDQNSNYYDFKLLTYPSQDPDITPDYDKLFGFLTDIASVYKSINNPYCCLDDIEGKMYCSYVLAFDLFRASLLCGIAQGVFINPPSFVSPLWITACGLTMLREAGDFMWAALDDDSVTYQVTNLGWIQLLGGTLDGEQHNYWPKDLYLNSARDTFYRTRYNNMLGRMEESLLYLMVLAWLDRSQNPLNYAFVPFNNDTTNFSDAQYYIKTDAENQAIATKAMTAIVGIMIGVAVGVTVGVALHQRKLRKQAKYMTYLGQIDQASWDGLPPTSNQVAKYRRYSRKLDKLTSVSKDIVAGSTSAFDTVVEKSGLMMGSINSVTTRDTLGEGHILPSVNQEVQNVIINLSDIEKLIH